MLEALSANMVFVTEHLTSILIAVLTLFVSFNGVLFDIRKNDLAKPSVKNTSNYGRLFILTIFILGAITLIQQINDRKSAETDKKQLDEELNDVRAQLATAQAQRIKLKDITIGIKGVSEKTKSIVTKTNGLATNIQDISSKTEGVTKGNQTLLGYMNIRSESSVEQQNQILLNIDGLKFELAEQGKRIEEILKKNDIDASDKFKSEYAHVSFDSISVIENCEKASGNLGDFYYDFYANGRRLSTPRHTLNSPLKLPDGATSQGEPLGEIKNIKILGSNDIISLNGYIRERDQKNILFRWTYKYDGVFSKSVVVSQARETIQVIDYPDCSVKLNVSIRITDMPIPY